ncbi:MAG: methyltransferase domain-containing protein [Gammaproteobacteria bacterium]|nr:methyltransferase domain-containing protein [Gammaproteobacteria bacterium]
MSNREPADVPTPIDFLTMRDAQEWESKAMLRPYREDFFAVFADELKAIDKPAIRILELGSGPGFLAHHVLSKIPGAQLTLLDYSSAMHELARHRLIDNPGSVTFVERSFKESGWEVGLGQFDAVITNQAVHELRHKRYAAALHAQVKGLLRAGGVYLVADHYFGERAMQNDQLYMSLAEQRSCLESAGFTVSEILVKGGRALYRAT